MLSKKQPKVVKGSQPLKTKSSSKPRPPNTDSDQSDSDTTLGAEASTSQVPLARRNPFAILDDADSGRVPEAAPASAVPKATRRAPAQAAQAHTAVGGSVRTHDAQGRPLTVDYYRAFQKLTLDSAGDVVLRFHKTDIVRVRASGDVVLTAGGYYTNTTLRSMNDCLRGIGLGVKETADGTDWVVEDAYGRYAYADNMTVKARASADKGRVAKVIATYQGVRGQTPAPGGPAASSSSSSSAASRTIPHAAPATLSLMDATWPAMPSTADVPVATARSDPSVHPKAARLSVGDYAQWAGPIPAVAAGGSADTDSTDGLCVVCMDAERDTVLVPCGHCMLCERCCLSVMASRTKQCPMCRQPVSVHVVIQLVHV